MSFGLSKYYAEKEVTEYLKSDYYWDFYYKVYVWKEGIINYHMKQYPAMWHKYHGRKEMVSRCGEDSPYKFSRAWIILWFIC